MTTRTTADSRLHELRTRRLTFGPVGQQLRRHLDGPSC
jgi:hypothetical protein